MKMRWLLVLLLLSTSANLSRADQEDSCHLGTNLKKLVSDNAYLKSPPTATNHRDWSDYENNLAIKWNDFFMAKTLIDLGAGQGMAVREAIESGEFKNAIAIDLTDFSSAKHWDYARESTLPKIRFEEDSAEAALLRYPNTADVIVDNYGAFTYSPARIHILNSAFRALKPGGIAYFRCPPLSFVSSGGRMTPLEIYLSQKYPRIFTVRKNRTTPFENPDLDPYTAAETVLVMKRPKDGTVLDLELEIGSHQKWNHPNYFRIEFPFLTYIEK
jgi:SAM-dependent methyltransferase